MCTISRFLLPVLFLAYGFSAFNQQKLEERFKWTTLDFNFADKSERQKALEDRSYIPNNTIPFGMAVWRDKLFITVPRRSRGVPATLNYINFNSNNTSPLLNPYPSWSSNKPTSGNIVSIYRANVDSCDRLWAVDTGSVGGFDGNGQNIQSSRLLVIDLKTNSILRSHQIRTSPCNAVYISILPDIRDSCEDAYAYAVDPNANGLLVYSYQRDSSWRKSHPYFSANPFQMDFCVNGLNFQWNDGVFGFALAELSKQKGRWAYLHPMSSLNEFIIDTKFLRDPNTSRLALNQVLIADTRKPTFQAASQAYDETSGVLFYSLVNKNAIGCWNTRKQVSQLGNTDIVDSNDRTMIYFTEVQVDKTGRLWALVNSFPQINYGGGLRQDRENFRVFTASVKQAIKNTNCDASRSFWPKKVQI